MPQPQYQDVCDPTINTSLMWDKSSLLQNSGQSASSTPPPLSDQMLSFCKLDLELLGQWWVGTVTEQG